MITLKDAKFGYASRAVVHVRALEIRAGRCLGIYGPNGAGKTTLLKGIAGQIKPISGEVTREAVRAAWVPQRQGLDALWPMAAFDVAALTLSAHRRLGLMGAAKHDVRAMLAALNLGSFANKPFQKLSGGQQQRVLIAGALAAKPQLLLLDEPTDGLDAQATDDLLALIRAQVAAGLAVVIISHDTHELKAVADDMAVLTPQADDAPSVVTTGAPA